MNIFLDAIQKKIISPVEIVLRLVQSTSRDAMLELLVRKRNHAMETWFVELGPKGIHIGPFCHQSLSRWGRGAQISRYINIYHCFKIGAIERSRDVYILRTNSSSRRPSRDPVSWRSIQNPPSQANAKVKGWSLGVRVSIDAREGCRGAWGREGRTRPTTRSAASYVHRRHQVALPHPRQDSTWFDISSGLLYPHWGILP